VHTSVAARVRAPRDVVLTLFLDWRRWPSVFPATIASVRLLHADATLESVEVLHRREGRVRNDLWTCAPGVVELREYKPRYDATFLNHFEHALDGTEYRIDAEVRFHRPYALLAPLLPGVVERALRRHTLEPVRRAAERVGEASR